MKISILRLRWAVLLITAVPVMDSSAQTNISLDVPRVVPISPTAAAMEKYQSYPVDRSTGIPSINIPLYQIVAGEVTIPVSLSYHASGLKPKEAGSYAGTGWTLNLEPSVSRQVCGAADDSDYGWFNNPNRNYNPPMSGDPELYNAPRIEYYNQLVNNIRDTQPDKFSYRLSSGSGSGYFVYDRNFLSIPRNNDKVEYYSGGGMRITDSRGIQYRFDGETEHVQNIITRWMCKSIWSPNNPIHPLVEFSYTNLPYHYTLGHYYNLDSKVIINRTQHGSFIKNLFTEQTILGLNQHHSIDYTGNPNAQLTPISASQAGVNYPGIAKHIASEMTAVRLNEVNFLGNKMFVSYKTVGVVPFNTEVLDDIEIVDEKGILVRSIKFHIHPYNAGTHLTKLDSVVISAPGVESRSYAFDYNAPYAVPPNYTKAVDHWGFCNGPDYSGGSTVPSFQQAMVFPDVNHGFQRTMIVSFSGANREPNHTATQNGVLSRITDPQGITTTFTYEGNFAAFRDNRKLSGKDYLHPVGGLRVKQIEARDPITGKWMRTSYTYGLTKPELSGYSPVWGGGAIKHIVSLRDYTSFQKVRYKDPNTNAIWFDDLTTFGSMPESNISFQGGSSVLYNIVKEESWNSTDNNTQRTDYYYNVKRHNFEDVLQWDNANPSLSVQTFLREQPEATLQQIARVMPAHPREPSDDYVNHNAITNQLYGKLMRKNIFRNNKLAARTNYAYKKETVWDSNIAFDLPHRLITGNTEGLAVNDVFLTGNYYFPGPSGAQTTYYLDTEMYAALEKETESMYYDIDGRQEVVSSEKLYNYQFDRFNPGSSLEARRIQTTNSDGTVVIDSLDYLLGYPAILARHKHMEGSGWKESRILFKPNSSLPDKVQSRTDQITLFRDEVKYNAYDAYGNVTELMGKDGMPVSFVWSYRGHLPVARIENATIAQVYGNTNAFESWTSSSEPPFALWSKLELLRTELPQARITTFAFNPLKGVVSTTDPNNITTKFDYDHYGRLTNSYFLDVKSPTDIRKAMLQKYIYKLGK